MPSKGKNGDVDDLGSCHSPKPEQGHLDSLHFTESIAEACLAVLETIHTMAKQELGGSVEREPEV